jgi:hypothetical protein
MGSESSESRESHPLLEPRIGAAFAAVALGCGVGFALMLAKIFILLGLALSLVSVLAVVWLYWRHFHQAYVSLRTRALYSGIDVREMVIVGLVVFISGPLSIAVYIAQSKDSPILNRSIVVLSGVQFEQYADVSPPTLRVKVIINNIGNLVARNVSGYVEAIIVDTLDTSEIERRLSQFIKIADDIDSGPGWSGADLNPGMGLVVHARRFDSINSISDLDISAVSKSIFMFPKHELDDIKTDKKKIFVIYLNRWNDDAIEGYWQVAGCGLYEGDFSYVRLCSDSIVKRINKSRINKN